MLILIAGSDHGEAASILYISLCLQKKEGQDSVMNHPIAATLGQLLVHIETCYGWMAWACVPAVGLIVHYFSFRCPAPRTLTAINPLAISPLQQ